MFYTEGRCEKDIPTKKQNIRKVISPTITKSYRTFLPRHKNSPRKPRNMKTIALVFEPKSESDLTCKAKPSFNKILIGSHLLKPSLLAIEKGLQYTE